ncbi:MAG: EAL domain-containing protein [Rhizobiales bacterium]|mgnify:FL=1|nr:EAL domain-containing protein [Hyphomicrobiales bacterium]
MLDHLDVADAAWISEVTEAISENRIQIMVQGVHSITDVDRTLYGECFARLIDPEGNIHTAGEFVPILELWGKTPMLDRHVLGLVLDELSSDPHVVLGCNISSDSLADEQSWQPLKDQLENRRHLIDRLVLEITETRPLGNIINVRERISEARQFGCRVAVDDFGCGNIVPSQLLNLDIDIVKIDAVFVRNIKESGGGQNSLYHMIGLAKCSSPIVVVEGVETVRHLIDAMTAGSTHVQGYYLSKPEFLHSIEPVLRANTEGKSCQ